MGYLASAAEFVYKVKMQQEVEDTIAKLAGGSINQLVLELSNDDEKKAFWINLYNGFILYTIAKSPGDYDNKHRFFTKKQIKVAGEKMSFDNIEHGYLRKSKLKWSFGYLGNPFVSKLEKLLRVVVFDNRIHFALNCGANSCPPVAFYSSDKINEQLELAKRSYLQQEVRFDINTNTVSLPKILWWFIGDFGGMKGIREILAQLNFVGHLQSPRIVFSKYDWSLNINK